MLYIAFIVALAACLMQPEPAPTSQSSHPGRIELRFDTPHDLASQRESKKRFRWNEKFDDYTLADETFQIYVPPDYKPDGEPYGLFVWVSPMGRGGVPKIWLEILDSRKLIWIGPDNIGNERLIDHRTRISVEAVLHMQERYRIDPDRVYIGGLSGGGKISAMSAVNYPEVFDGAFSICGSIFYRNIPTGLKKDEIYPQGYYPPPPKMLAEAKTRLRHVLLTGTEDFNLQPTQRMYDLGYVKDKFKYVTLLIVPGLEHTIPPADWFAKGIDFLDAGRTEPPESAKPATRPARP